MAMARLCSSSLVYQSCAVRHALHTPWWIGPSPVVTQSGALQELSNTHETASPFDATVTFHNVAIVCCMSDVHPLPRLSNPKKSRES